MKDLALLKALLFEEFEENKMCEACGGIMENGMCNECGWMEEDLKGGQKKLDVAPPFGKLTGADFKNLQGKNMKDVVDDYKKDLGKGTHRQNAIIAANAKAKEAMKGMKEDHEVGMAQSSLESIIKSALELKAKLGNAERNIPGWIQDHITNAENYIDQAAQGFHELSQDDQEKPEVMSERREYDQDAMEKLGFDLYSGGRIEAWEFATEELGISPAEILGKMSDDDVYNAIDSSLQILGFYNDEDEDLYETSLGSMLDNLLEAKKKPSAGLTKKQKSTIAKKAKAGKDVGKKGKGFEKVAKTAAKKYGSKEKGQKVAAAAMWKSAAKKAK